MSESGDTSAPNPTAANGTAAAPLIRVRDLRKHIPIKQGVLRRTVGQVRIVDGLTFDIPAGETLGLVGEPGNGKSTAGRTILLLETPTAGQIFYDNRELTAMSSAEVRRMRRHLQMLFHDPYTALNPRLTVGQLITEPLTIHNIGSEEDRDRRVEELLRQVGLNPYLSNRLPHELSGGQRMRVGVARALATQPSFIVADEPLSALDSTVQPQLIALLGRLQDRLGLTYLYIARDLSQVGRLADRIAIIYLGRIVELGTTTAIYERPLHPYTRALAAAAPPLEDATTGAPRPLALPGRVPSPADPPSGCHFHPRCAYATDLCRQTYPDLRDLGPEDTPHRVACHHAEQFL